MQNVLQGMGSPRPSIRVQRSSFPSTLSHHPSPDCLGRRYENVRSRKRKRRVSTFHERETSEQMCKSCLTSTLRGQGVSQSAPWRRLARMRSSNSGGSRGTILRSPVNKRNEIIARRLTFGGEISFLPRRSSLGEIRRYRVRRGRRDEASSLVAGRDVDIYNETHAGNARPEHVVVSGSTASRRVHWAGHIQHVKREKRVQSLSSCSVNG